MREPVGSRLMKRVKEMLAEDAPEREILELIAREEGIPVEAAEQVLAFWRGENADDVRRTQ